MNLRSLVVAAALVATSGVSRPAAQGDAEYLALLDRYVTGEPTDAATALASWPASRVRTAVRAVESRLSPAKLRTAVMLHTESGSATSMASLSSISWTSHVGSCNASSVRWAVHTGPFTAWRERLLRTLACLDRDAALHPQR